jgi:uncharacterized protein (TIGR02597 family)
MQRANYARGLRFLPKVATIITVGLISASIAYQASAQVNVYTDPVGFITITAEGTSGPGSSPALSFWGLGMTQIPALRGAVTAVSGQAVAVGGLTAGQFNAGPRGNLYYIEDVNSNSANAGLTDDILSNDANNVYTEFSDPIVVGDNVKIYPHWTISSVFGPQDQAGLLQGAAGSCDEILIQNPVSQLYSTYYYATATKSLSAGWKSTAGGNTDYSTLPIYQDQGLLISRVVSTNLAYQLVGAVKLGATQIPLLTNNNFAANVYAASTITLANSGLYTDGNATDSFVAGSAGSTDEILIHNDATGLYSTYYYATATKSLSAGWKSTAGGNTDQSQTILPLGSTVLIEMKHPGFIWKEGAPY